MKSVQLIPLAFALSLPFVACKKHSIAPTENKAISSKNTSTAFDNYFKNVPFADISNWKISIEDKKYFISPNGFAGFSAKHGSQAIVQGFSIALFKVNNQSHTVLDVANMPNGLDIVIENTPEHPHIDGIYPSLTIGTPSMFVLNPLFKTPFGSYAITVDFNPNAVYHPWDFMDGAYISDSDIKTFLMLNPIGYEGIQKIENSTCFAIQQAGKWGVLSGKTASEVVATVYDSFQVQGAQIILSTKNNQIILDTNCRVISQ